MQSKNQNFVSGLSSVLPAAVSACCTSGDDYFSSSEYVSSSFSSAVRAPFVNQIVAGGKKIVLTAALAGMLNTNLVQPALGQFSGTVSSGVTVTGQIVTSGTQNILYGGTAVNGIIRTLGVQNVSGLASNTAISSGGVQYVANGGIASSTTINAYGSQVIYNGGIASNTTVNSRGSQVVNAGGSAMGGSLSGTSAVQIVNGSASGITVNNGGAQDVSSGGLTLNTIVNSYGYQYVSYRGIASDTILNVSASQAVASGGSAMGTIVHSRGMQVVYGGGYASGAVLNAGGSQRVNGGSAFGTIINGGTQDVYSGGIVTSTVINSGGYQAVSYGCIASNTIVNSGGYQVVQASAVNTIISGGTQTVYWGATVNSTFLINGTMSVAGGSNVTGITANGGTISALSNGVFLSNVVLNGTTVDMRGSSAGNVLTIQDLGAFNNPVVRMNVELGDETSPSDLLKVTGVYDGNALLQVSNTGSGGVVAGGSGIKVVDLSEATGNGTFALPGGKIDTGAYNYFLEQNESDSNYYLVTFMGAMNFTNVYKTMLNAPLINVFTARSAMTSLEGRLGDLRTFGYEQNKNGLWVRTYGKNATVGDFAETDVTLFGLEAGYDGLFNFLGHKLYAGLNIGYANVGEIQTKINKNSTGTGSQPSFGLYASLVGNNDYFADLAIKEIISNLEMTNYASDGTEMNYEPKRNILALTLEGGKQFKKELQASYVRIEPKAGILFMSTESGNVKVKNGDSDLEYDGVNYLTAKAGIIVGLVKTADGKAKIEPLIELAYLQELLGKGKVRYNGVERESDMSGGSVEIGAGLNAKLSDKIRLYGQINYESGEKIKATGVNVGAQYSF
ncbi:MAG: autotransporter outer membrane beta-barrel domain-containing protein [Endomicrobia bacterium]|nr:autotransporter outer membrane beta-barrel domain-containing protein [Endomicrobiia bacterium]